MSAGVPRMCISTTGQPRAATSGAARGSCARADTSFTMVAPASSAAAIVAAWRVSTETRSPAAARPRITGTMRLRSSAGEVGADRGRVLSPPTSMMSAPAAAIARPAAIAASGSRKSPPSLKLSGVTFSTPMTRGRSRLRPAQKFTPEPAGPRHEWLDRRIRSCLPRIDESYSTPLKIPGVPRGDATSAPSARYCSDLQFGSMKRSSLASSLGREVGIRPRGGTVKRQDTACQQRRKRHLDRTPQSIVPTPGRHAGETTQHLGLGDGRCIEVLDRLRVGPRDHRWLGFPSGQLGHTLVSITIMPVDPDSNQVQRNPAVRGQVRA